MEALIAAAGVVLVAIASIFAALFQSKRRGRAEGEAAHQEYKAAETESILDDVKLANEARDNLRSGSDKRTELHDKYNRDSD
jgi:signal transduction histidine kinase